jgi:hypothetical protein
VNINCIFVDESDSTNGGVSRGITQEGNVGSSL